MTEKMTDFGSSFLTYKVKEGGNHGRFQIESLTTVRSAAGTERCILLHPVLACDVYGTGMLFKQPPYRYQAIFSKDRFKIFRTYLTSGRRDDSSGTITRMFSGIKFSERRRDAILLEDGSKIVSWAGEDGVIVARAAFDQGAEHVTVEFPVRHINTDPTRSVFQVEIGTVALPVVSDPSLSVIDRMEIHYLAFNTLTAMSVLSLPAAPARRQDCTIRLYGCGIT